MDTDQFDIDDSTPVPMELDNFQIEEYEDETDVSKDDSTTVVPATPSSLEEPVACTLRTDVDEWREHDDGVNEDQVAIVRDEIEETMDDQYEGDNDNENDDQESVLREEEFEDLRDNELSVSDSESNDDKDEAFEEHSEDEGDDGAHNEEDDEAEDESEYEGIDDMEDKENDPEEDDDEEVQILQGSDAEQEQENEKVLHLPVSKVKKLMKVDNPITLFGKDAVAAMAISTELFISLLAQQSYKMAASNKKRTVQLSHLKRVLPSSPLFDFLEGTLPEYDI